MQMNKWWQAWKRDLAKNKYFLLASIIFFLIANYANYVSSTYADTFSGYSVPDLILDHIPTLRLDWLFAWGLMIVILAIIIYTLIFHIKEAHRIIFQFSLLILVRSFFISLTHISQPAAAKIVSNVPAFYHLLWFRNDLFFSGHTAVPFLAFLLFRKEKIRIFFLAMTIMLAITVLLMHVHYSIDVFSAFFITYGTYHAGEWLYRKFCF